MMAKKKSTLRRGKCASCGRKAVLDDQDLCIICRASAGKPWTGMRALVW